MVAKRSAQAERLLQEGALPQDVDEAIRAFGFPMGPLQTNDMSGLDVGYAIRKRRGTKFHIADAIVEAGRSEEHTSELQSLMRISYAVFCLTKKTHTSQLTIPVT